jgi:hypothetical protein
MAGEGEVRYPMPVSKKKVQMRKGFKRELCFMLKRGSWLDPE